MQEQHRQEPVFFTLKEEHIKLIEKLNFKVCAETEYNDRYIPGIDRKRPFGNSGATGDVLEILGRECDEEGEFREEDIDEAETLLVELPLALKAVVKNKTFTPGDYEVERYGAYSQYQMMRNYKALHMALDEVEGTLCQTDANLQKFGQLQTMCINVFGDDPWEAIQYIGWGKGKDPFWDSALEIFLKHKAMNRKRDLCAGCVHNAVPSSMDLDCEYACAGVSEIADEGCVVLSCSDYQEWE